MKWNLANSRLANGKSQRYIKRCQNAVKQRRFPNKYRIWKYVQFCYNSFILSEFREQLQKLWCNFELCVIMTLKCWHLNFFSEFELYMVASNRTHQHSYKYEERKNRRKNNCAQLQLRCKRLWNLRHVLANQFHTLLDSSWYSQYTQQFLHPSSRFVVVFFLVLFFSYMEIYIFDSITFNILFKREFALQRTIEPMHILSHLCIQYTYTIMSHFIFVFFIPLTVCQTANTILFSFHRIGSETLKRFPICNRKEMWNVLFGIQFNASPSYGNVTNTCVIPVRK